MPKPAEGGASKASSGSRAVAEPLKVGPQKRPARLASQWVK